MPACTQKTPKLRCYFLKRRLKNTFRRHRLADGQLSSLYPPSPSFNSFDTASVMLCCSPPPACSSTPLRPSVHYPRTSPVVNILCIQTFGDHLNAFYIFGQKDCIVLKSGESFTVRMPASSLVALPSPPLTSRRHRQADGQLSPLYPPLPSFSLFGAACVKLCGLPLPSLVRNIRLCCLV